MASASIVRYTTRTGKRRYRVVYRLGGRGAKTRHAGSFPTLREADRRLEWVRLELAAGRPPDLQALTREPERPTLLREHAEAWRASRHDVAEATRGVDRKAVAHVVTEYGDRDPGTITWQEIHTWLGGLGNKYTRGTCGKILHALRAVLDHADVSPNPARDPRVKLRREERREIQPPNRAETTILLTRAAPKYRLPLLVLEVTGMRVHELEALTWGDVDEHGRRWRVTRQTSKTGRARWVPVPADVLDLVADLVPREDRDLDALVFPDVTQARLRTDMARTCRAAGIPLYSPHDLRHRRISLLHMAGVPWAVIGEQVGQANLSTTADTYTHVLTDGEVDYRQVLPDAVTVPHP